MVDGNVVSGNAFALRAGMLPKFSWLKNCWIPINGKKLFVAEWAECYDGMGGAEAAELKQLLQETV